ncbi:MAG: acylphosphatase [Planctomycetes bacterium]|nr:acylphosphatase [Planctomycetota bacterium]
MGGSSPERTAEEGRSARRYRVEGRVQGVGFRWHTRECARRLGLHGWVRNRPDGAVEVWAEGPALGLEALRAWLAVGPIAAQVHSVAEEAVAAEGLAGFELRR